MRSFYLDPNEAVKCVDIIPLTLLASLSRQNGDDIWPNLRRFINQFMKDAGIKTWRELTIGVHQLEGYFLTMILSIADLSFKGEERIGSKETI